MASGTGLGDAAAEEDGHDVFEHIPAEWKEIRNGFQADRGAEQHHSTHDLHLGHFRHVWVIEGEACTQFVTDAHFADTA